MKDVPFLPLLARYFAGRPEMIAAYLFGSYAEGVARRDSDVDIAILLKTIPLDTLKYRLEVMDHTQRIVKRNTEVIILNDAPKLLQFQVIQKGIVVFEKDAGQRALFEMGIAGRYYDYKRYFEFHTRELSKRLREGGLGVRQ